jgi:GntR family transcriptional regulator / MocR family aminotransferase
MKRVSTAAIAGVFGPQAGSVTPLHRQLYEVVRQEVLLRHFSPGQQMPSTRVLAADLRISRNTVLNAFEQLKAEGYLEGTAGSGTYIARALPDEMTRALKMRPPASPLRINTPRLSRFGSHIMKQGAAAVLNGVPVRPFQPGIPALDAFPFEIWTQISNRQWKSRSSGLLTYSGTAGYLPLRKAVAGYLRVSRAVRCEPEQVIIVSGTRQALDLSVRLLLDPADAVWMEDPGYFGAHSTLKAAAARLIPVPVDADGLNVAEGISRCPKARMAYTTPSHQFPLGTPMSVARRLQLLKWAADTNAWILEDDYDSEFRYSSRPLPALQSLDQAGSVIYIGTFSKLLFPALRLAYLVAPPDLVNRYLIAKAVTDGHAPTVDQAILAEFMEEGHFTRHIRRMRALYLERLEMLLEAARAEIDGAVNIRRPDAGMHAVALLPPESDDRSVAAAAATVGVASMPLSHCYLGRPKAPGLLLGYAAFGQRQIRLGIRKLSGILTKNGR